MGHKLRLWGVVLAVSVSIGVLAFLGAGSASGPGGKPSSSLRTAAGSAPVRANVPAQDFTLADLNGEQISLAGQKGQVVLLNFWATW